MTLVGGVSVEARELDKVSFVRNLFLSARQYRQRRVETWRQNYQLVHNRAWNPSRDAWMPSPAASETFPIIAALVGWMTDQRTALYVNPAGVPGGEAYQIAARLAIDLQHALEANWSERDTQTEHEKMLWDGLTYGTGFLKTLWDASLESGLGDAKAVRVDPFAMYVDPQASSLDNANYLIEANTMSLQELDRRYPGAGDMIAGTTEESGSLDQRPELYAVGRPPMANPGGLFGNAPRYGLPGGDPNRASASRYDMGVTVYEAWIREHDLYVDDEGEDYVDDRWRLLVVSGNRVLMDEPAEALFGHGRHPYTRYVPTDNGEFWGISLVEHLKPLQIHLNRLLAAIQLNAELTGNPVFLEDTRSGLQRTRIVSKPGTRLTKGVGSEVGWMTPPGMSDDVLELIRFYIGEMERVSGLSAIVRGATPLGRNAQGVLDAVQEAAFVRVRLALRNLERTLRESGKLTAHLIAENYTQPRIIAITGQQSSTPLVLRARHFYVAGDAGEEMPLKFSLMVEAGASLPTSRSARTAEADVLFSMGALDREAVLEAHNYPNWQQIVERIVRKEAIGMFQAPGARQRRR